MRWDNSLFIHVLQALASLSVPLLSIHIIDSSLPPCLQAQKHPAVTSQATQTPVLATLTASDRNVAKQNSQWGPSVTENLNKASAQMQTSSPGLNTTSARLASHQEELQQAQVKFCFCWFQQPHPRLLDGIPLPA